jgi:hypothetical protein
MCGWLSFNEAGVVFPEFDRHNGKSAKLRADAAIRQRVSRQSRDIVVTKALPEKRREEKSVSTSLRSVDARSQRKARETLIPDDFAISDRVKTWATKHGHTRLQERFEHFVSKAKAKGYKYADWDEGFMGAIRDDWPKFNAPSKRNGAADAREERRQRDYHGLTGGFGFGQQEDEKTIDPHD